jgi:hypothetical protein
MTSRASVEQGTLALSHPPEHIQVSTIVISYRDIPTLQFNSGEDTSRPFVLNTKHTYILSPLTSICRGWSME